MGEPGRAQRCQWLGRPAPAYVAARIRPTRNVGAGGTGHWWLRPSTGGSRSTPATPTIHILHRIHSSWRLSPATGLPTGLWCPPAVQFWLWASASTAGSVCPSRGPSSTCYSGGSTSGLPATSISGHPRHEQTPNGAARLSLRPVRLRTGFGRLWTGLLGPQPAAPFLWRPLGARLRGTPRRRKWLRPRAEPQRARLPPIPALAARGRPSPRPALGNSRQSRTGRKAATRPGGRGGARLWVLD